MKRWIEWLLQNKRRRLEVSTGGRWYLGFTILLGVAAINSGNNVIYLLESLLLSALILSGVLSEQTLLKTKVSRILGQAKAGEKISDILLVQNMGRIPLYCVEIGEWKNGQFEQIAFLLILPGRAKVRVKSNQTISKRGYHRWEKLAVATSFPFGFARKIRFLEEPGVRVVWPKSEKNRSHRLNENQKRGSETEILVGEIEEVPAYGDVSRVHWPSSGRTNSLMAIPRGKLESESEVFLELCQPGQELERRIALAAGALDSLRAQGTLVLRENGQQKRVQGLLRSMDVLASLPQPPEIGVR